MPAFCRALVLAGVALLSGCGSSAPAAGPANVGVYRLVGSWQGKGDMTLGDVNSEGQFRLRWETHAEDSKGAGRFRLLIRSGVSGRTLQVAADHKGEGSGVVDFADSPRTYDFLVESAHVLWSFTVEDLVPVRDSAGSR